MVGPHKAQIILASTGLAIGVVLGLAGSFVGSDDLRAALWTIDAAAIIAAACVLGVHFIRRGDDLASAGFFLFAIAEAVIMVNSEEYLIGDSPMPASGICLWSVAFAMISAARAFPVVVRLLGFVTAAAFAVTTIGIFAGLDIDFLSKPLPFFAYPLLSATMIGWIISLLRRPAS